MKVQHMVVNNCGVGSLLLLENSKLAPQIQKNCFKNCPPLENYTRAEAERLIERLKSHNIEFRGKHRVMMSPRNHLFRGEIEPGDVNT